MNLLGLDEWLESPYHEGEEPPCEITLQQDYLCDECGGNFTQEDVESENYIIDDTFDGENWRPRHARCKSE